MELEYRKKSRNLISPVKEQFVCVYRDQADGAKAIPLAIESDGLRIGKVSSSYFTGPGVGLNLILDYENKLMGIRMGKALIVTVDDLKKGVLFKPLSLFPAHIIQLNSEFSLSEGGVLRFGYLMQIFCWKTFKLALKHLVGWRVKAEEVAPRDLISHWGCIYGAQRWGTFEIALKKNEEGKWQFSMPLKGMNKAFPIGEIVTEFCVNRRGIVTGLKKMWVCLKKRSNDRE